MTSSPSVPINRNLAVVFVEDHPRAIMLLRVAALRAQEKGIKWRALHVETPSQFALPEDGAQERILKLLTHAEQMGAEILHVEAETAEKGIRSVLEAEKERLALFLLGKGFEPEGWLHRFRAPKWKRIRRLAKNYAPVEVVPLAGQTYHRPRWERALRAFRPRDMLYALGAVGVAYGAAVLLQWALPPALFRVNMQNVGLLFMTACAFAAGRYGLLPGLVASVASSLTVNFYFTPPFYNLRVDSVTDLLNMAIFLFAALLISLFTSQTRGHAEQIARRERSTQALFTLYRIASNAFSRQQALEKLQRKLMRMLEMDVAFFLPAAVAPDRIEAAVPAGLALDGADAEALEVCWKEMKTTGLASPFNPGAHWRFEPMVATGGEIGVLGIRPRPRMRLDAWFGRLLTGIAEQTAVVIERIELERSMEATRIREEREKLRSMLLSSVSHDLKTPLAAIIGALSVHRSLGARLAPVKQEELIETALEEAQRLDSFITNILDMTRLEGHKIEFHQEWHSMESTLQQVMKRLQHRLRHHPLTVHPLPENVEVFLDAMMTEQVLQNLLDNACKYTPPGTAVELRCYVDKEKGYCCEVRDHGPGLPPENTDRVFDKYARLQKKDSQVAGTGLGLSIAKAVVEGQGGWISAGNHPAGGALFTLCLPKWRKAKNETQQRVA